MQEAAGTNLTYEDVSGDVALFHHNPALEGSLFQVASQFNVREQQRTAVCCCCNNLNMCWRWCRQKWGQVLRGSTCVCVCVHVCV